MLIELSRFIYWCASALCFLLRYLKWFKLSFSWLHSFSAFCGSTPLIHCPVPSSSRIEPIHAIVTLMSQEIWPFSMADKLLRHPHRHDSANVVELPLQNRAKTFISELTSTTAKIGLQRERGRVGGGGLEEGRWTATEGQMARSPLSALPVPFKGSRTATDE